MEQAEAILKRIPLKDIQMPSHPVRHKINSGRVRMFQDKYNEGEQVPPIRVIPLQNGDPKNIHYIMVGGLHRYTALKTLDFKETDALIDVANTITTNDIDTNKSRLIIAHAQVRDNPAGSLQFTNDEIKTYAREAYSRGASIEEILSNTLYSKTTIYAWLEDLIDNEKSAKRRQLLKKHKQGAPLQDLATEFDVPKTTAHRWIKENQKKPKEPTQGPPPSDNSIFPAPEKWNGKTTKNQQKQDLDAAREEETPHNQDTPTHERQPLKATPAYDFATEEDQYSPERLAEWASGLNDFHKLESIAVIIQSLQPTPDMEKEIFGYIYPAIARQFPTLQEDTIKSIDYAHNAEQLQEHVTILKNRAMTLNRQLTESKKKNALLEEEIEKRKTICSMTCPYTMERMEHEEEKNIKNTVDQIKELTLFLSGTVTKMKEKQITPLQKKLQSHVRGPHEKPIKEIARQLILNLSYTLASQLEASTDQAMLTTDKVNKYLDETKKRLAGIGIRPHKAKKTDHKTPTPSRSLSDNDAYKNLYNRFDGIVKKMQYIEDRQKGIKKQPRPKGGERK